MRRGFNLILCLFSKEYLAILNIMYERFKKEKERFANFYIENDKTGCWEWYKPIKAKPGYPALRMFGKYWYAHRLCYYIYKGDVPTRKSGMVVMHTCDNRTCVNPAHLKLGTQKENLRDAINKNRVPQLTQWNYHGKGWRGNPRLTDEIKREIQSIRQNTQGKLRWGTVSGIAKKFNISERSVRYILYGD